MGRQAREERPRTVASNAFPVTADGSIMMIVATDAPVDARNLHRLAARTMMGLGRTGSAGSNGSGDGFNACGPLDAEGFLRHAGE